MIISPCIGICKTHHRIDYFYGYGIDNNEKKLWKSVDITDQQKNDNLTNIKKKPAGWQLENLKYSYKHKLKNDIFLF